MAQVFAATKDWRPDVTFLLWHGLLPLVVAIGLLWVMESSGLDLWLADRWFAMEGGEWSLKSHWLTSDLIHHYGKQMVIAIAMVLPVLLLVSFRIKRLRPWRRPVGYLLTCMLVLPGFIAGLKRFSTVPCPWSLERYGGVMEYRHSLEYALAYGAGGNCFPAGHASGGFVLIALYFATFGRVQRSWPLLLPGLFIGWVFALGQQARGAHFLSHDLWTLSVCWFGAFGLFLLIKPWRSFGVVG